VCSIVKSSAADQCGLRCGDIIIQFGHLNKMNWNGLRDIPPLVLENVKKVIPITVLRRTSCKRSNAKTYKRISLRAIPAQWNEGAVLGCVLNTWPPPLPVHHPTGPKLLPTLSPPLSRPATPQHRNPLTLSHPHNPLSQGQQKLDGGEWKDDTFGGSGELGVLHQSPSDQSPSAISSHLRTSREKEMKILPSNPIRKFPLPPRQPSVF